MGCGIAKNGYRGVCGPEIRFLEVCRKLDTSLIYPIIVYPVFGQLIKEFLKLENEKKVIVESYYPRFRWDYIIMLFRVLKKYRVNAVHSQGPKLFDAIAVVLSKIFEIKSIITRPVNISQDHLGLLKKFIFYC